MVSSSLVEAFDSRRVFAEKAERAAHWALQYLQAARPGRLPERLGSLLQALASSAAYGRDASLPLALADQLGPRLIRAGLWGEWEPYLRECLRLAQACGDHPAEFRLLLALGDAHALRGDYPAALPFLEQAIRLEKHGGERWVEPYTRLAECQLSQGQPELARETLEQALGKANQRGDRLAQTNVTGQIGRVLRPGGEFEQAAAYFERALELSRQLGAANLELSNLVHLGTLALDRGHSELALEYLAEATVMTAEQGELSGQGTTLINVGRVHLAAGRLDAARCALEAGLAVHRALANRPKRAIALFSLGQLAVRQGDLETARGYLEEAGLALQDTANDPLLARLQRAWGEYFAAAGQPERARQAYDQSQALFLGCGETWLAAQVAAQLAAQVAAQMAASGAVA